MTAFFLKFFLISGNHTSSCKLANRYPCSDTWTPAVGCKHVFFLLKIFSILHQDYFLEKVFGLLKRANNRCCKRKAVCWLHSIYMTLTRYCSSCKFTNWSFDQMTFKWPKLVPERSFHGKLKKFVGFTSVVYSMLGTNYKH